MQHNVSDSGLVSTAAVEAALRMFDYWLPLGNGPKPAVGHSPRAPELQEDTGQADPSPPHKSRALSLYCYYNGATQHLC